MTSTTAELNILDGVTSTTAELNILDGVTSTTAELNLLDGVTSTTSELNILDGVTVNASHLNATPTVSKWVLNNSTSGVASGDNITYTITHGMGASLYYGVEVIRIVNTTTAIPLGSTVEVDIVRASTTTITVAFAAAVTAGDYAALITKFD